MADLIDSLEGDEMVAETTKKTPEKIGSLNKRSFSTFPPLVPLFRGRHKKVTFPERRKGVVFKP